MDRTKPPLVGINFPWVSCGHDFGPHPPAWGGDRGPRDWSDVERELRELRDLGLEVVRWWILGGGVNYPVGRNVTEVGELVATGEGALHAIVDAGLGRPARRLARDFIEGRRFREVRLHPETPPPPLPAAFLEDFRGLLDACRRADVRLVPSLLSFELFQPAVELNDGLVKRGRRALVFGNPGEPSQLEAFLDATLSPLLTASDDHRDTLFAWEVVNEPEWAVITGPVQLDRPSYGWVPSLHTVEPAEMCALIERGVQRILDAGFVATVGFADDAPSWLAPGLVETLRAHAAAGRYVHQRHHYPTVIADHSLPRHDGRLITPCMLGEMPSAQASSASNIRWRDRELRTTERDPDRYLAARLDLAKSHGYPVALIWSARSGDERRTWDRAQKDQVRRYLRGS